MAKSNKKEEMSGNSKNDEELAMFAPLEELKFKPKLHPNECQYCGFTNKRKINVDKHINSQHEMSIWYKCNYCEYASVHGTDLVKQHIKKIHKLQVGHAEISKWMVKDPREIGRLKKSQMERTRYKNKRKLSNFKPIDIFDFKPSENPYSCQYCEYKCKWRSNSATLIHVNVNHEMTDWYQCSDCTYVCLSTVELRYHMIRCHDKYPSSKCLDSNIIKDGRVIQQLRDARIKTKVKSATIIQEKLAKRNLSKNPSETQSHNLNVIKDEIEIVEHSVAEDNMNFMSDLEADNTKIDVSEQNDAIDHCGNVSVDASAFKQHLKTWDLNNGKCTKAKPQRFLRETQTEIKDLKKKRNEIKSVMENSSTILMETASNNFSVIKDEVEIMEHSVEEDNEDFTTSLDDNDIKIDASEEKDDTSQCDNVSMDASAFKQHLKTSDLNNGKCTRTRTKLQPFINETQAGIEKLKNKRKKIKSAMENSSRFLLETPSDNLNVIKENVVITERSVEEDDKDFMTSLDENDIKIDVSQENDDTKEWLII